MLRLSSEVVASTSGRVQQHAATVVLETARCATAVASEGVPASTAELDEVNVLLDGLQSPSTALREICIQVLTPSLKCFLSYIVGQVL